MIANTETMSIFNMGDIVEKKSGSYWEGEIVGFYSTLQTPIGICVQLPTRNGNGPVQLYPEDAFKIKSNKPDTALELLKLVKTEGRLPPGRIRSRYITIPGSLWSRISMFIGTGSPKD